jgi:surface protein
MPSRTWASTIVGSSRSGVGSLNRVYNWCDNNDPNHLLACTFGINTSTFSFRWTIPAPGTLVELPLVNIHEGLAIDWGDGTTLGGVSLSHTYASPGTYTVIINDSFTQFGLGFDDRIGFENPIPWKGVEYVTEVISFNERLQSLTAAFAVSDDSGVSSLVKVPATLPRYVNDLSGMFINCTLLNDSNMSYWDTSNVTTMREMLSGATSFNQSISNWGVSKVTNMYFMLSTHDIININNMAFNNGAAPGVFTGFLFADGKTPTRALKNAQGIFSGCAAFNQSVNNWDTSSVTKMNELFSGCTSFNQSVSNWDVSKVTDMSNMFNGCTIFNNGGDTGYLFKIAPPAMVTTTAGMFQGCAAFNNSVSNWDVSKVTDMSNMFSQGPVATPMIFNNGGGTGLLFDPALGGKAPTSALTTTAGMFTGCTSFNRSVSNWDVSKVTDMSNMFSQGPVATPMIFNNGGGTGLLFDPALGGKAPTSALTTTARMFSDCTSFNQSVSNWDVSKVTIMSSMFNGCTIFNNGGDTGYLFKIAPPSALTTTAGMFTGCTSFNRSVSNWDVSKVTDMSNMFIGCTIFNNGTSLGVYLFESVPSKVTTTFAMFLRCSAFNRSVSNWDVINVVTMRSMFNGCTVYNYPLNTWTLSKNLQSDGMINLFRNSGLTQLNLNITLVAWKTQYDNSSPSFPTGVSLTGLPVSPSGDGLTAKNRLTTAPPGGPGWTIT